MYAILEDQGVAEESHGTFVPKPFAILFFLHLWRQVKEFEDSRDLARDMSLCALTEMIAIWAHAAENAHASPSVFDAAWFTKAREGLLPDNGSVIEPELPLVEGRKVPTEWCENDFPNQLMELFSIIPTGKQNQQTAKAYVMSLPCMFFLPPDGDIRNAMFALLLDPVQVDDNSTASNIAAAMGNTWRLNVPGLDAGWNSNLRDITKSDVNVQHFRQQNNKGS